MTRVLDTPIMRYLQQTQVSEAQSQPLATNYGIAERVSGALMSNLYSAALSSGVTTKPVSVPAIDLLDPRSIQLLRNILASNAAIRVQILAILAMAGDTGSAGKDGEIGERVDKVIGDVVAGRVSHSKVDDLAEAAARSQRDRKLGNAIGRPDKQRVGVFTG